MSVKQTYSFIPDAETLKRFYEGKLSSAESNAIAEAIAGDEFLREAFGGLNGSDFLMVESISSNVNAKIAGMIGKPPFYMRWQIWLSVFIGVLIITGYFIVSNSNVADEKKLAQQDTENQTVTDPNENDPDTKEKIPVTVDPSDKTRQGEKDKVKSDNTQDFNQDKANQSEMLKAFVNDTASKRKTHQDVVIDNNDGPAGDKLDQTVKPEDNVAQNNVTKTYRIRLSDAGLMVTENLAEKESSPNERPENFDPKSFKLGDPVRRKKSSNYKIEDMPSFKGGDDAFVNYVKGKIAIKSYKTEKKYMSTVVEFIVTPKGKIEQVKFVTPLDPTMEKDITGILTSTTFNPGKKTGKKGSMYYMMMMVFE